MLDQLGVGGGSGWGRRGRGTCLVRVSRCQGAEAAIGCQESRRCDVVQRHPVPMLPCGLLGGVVAWGVEYDGTGSSKTFGEPLERAGGAETGRNSHGGVEGVARVLAEEM